MGEGSKEVSLRTSEREVKEREGGGKGEKSAQGRVFPSALKDGSRAFGDQHRLNLRKSQGRRNSCLGVVQRLADQSVPKQHQFYVAVRSRCSATL